MSNQNIGITVVMPALNEENNILAALDNTLKAFRDYQVDGEIVVVNDGSTDRTEELVRGVMQKYTMVRLLVHPRPLGIGASFWNGVDSANTEAIVLLPGDNENDSSEIFRYYKLLEHVDIVIPFFFNREARSLFRNILSHIYRVIINITFSVILNYNNGKVLYRKSILNELGHRSSSFFFQTDILIRLIKRGYLFAEVPYRLGIRGSGESKAISFPSFCQVVGGYLRLIKDIYFSKEIKVNKRKFDIDSLSAKRYNAALRK